MEQNSLAILYKQLAEITEDDLAVVEARKAERAHRLAELVQSEVWKLDLYPILRRLHDAYLENVKSKKMDPDTLKVFDDILSQIDGTIRVGAGAMERLAVKRNRAAAIKNKINQAQSPSSFVDAGLAESDTRY